MGMMPAQTDGAGHRRARMICAFAALVLLGLGLWRGAEIFTKPAGAPDFISQEQQTLLHVLEPLAGAGNVRLTVRREEGGSRTFLVFVNTAAGNIRPLAREIETTLVHAAGFSSAKGDALTVREFPFAAGTSAAPQPRELIELGVIALLVFLLSWGAFAPQSAPAERTARKKPKPAANDAAPRPRPVAVDVTPMPGSQAASAAKSASEDPAGTAKIIRAWMRAPEDRS